MTSQFKKKNKSKTVTLFHPWETMREKSSAQTNPWRKVQFDSTYALKMVPVYYKMAIFKVFEVIQVTLGCFYDQKMTF